MNDLNNLPLVTFILLIIGLGILILFKNPHERVNRLFAGLSLTMSGWLFSNQSSNILDSYSLVLILNRLIFVSTSLFSCFLVLFCLSFPNKRNISTKQYLFIIFFPILVSLLSMTDLIAKNVIIGNHGSTIIFGSLSFIYVVQILTYFIISFVLLIKNFINSRNIQRRQIKFLFVGLLTTITIACFTNLFLPFAFNYFKLTTYGGYSVIFFVIFTSYSIMKLKFMDIRVLLTEVGSGIVVLASMVQLFFSKFNYDRIINTIVLVAVSYGGYLLIKSVNQEIKRREEMEGLAKDREKAMKQVGERNRNLLTLQKLSDIVLDNDELKPMIQQIINTIPKELGGCIGAVVVLVDSEEEKMKGFCVSQTQASDDLNRVWQKAVKSYCVPLKSQENLLMTAYHYQVPQKGNHLADFMCPPFDNSVAHDLQVKSKIKGLMAVPLSAKEEKFGVLVFALDKHVEDVSPELVSMMSAIANEVSLAVQRALAYENLKTANEYLKEVDKMKDEFISVASHELNTPLAAIQGYLSMILEEGMGKVDKTAEEYLNRVYSSSKRLAALILDLLNVSRIEQGRIHLMYGQITPQDLIKSVIDELIVKSNMKKIYLKFEKPTEELPETWCDVNRIREVIINLIGNGIKFTDTGGITIAVKMVAKQFEFSVTDTGVGIKQEDAEKLFKKFSQLNREKNEFQGSGLGLFISKKLIELHGGKIWVECEEGNGTTFKFRLPYVKNKPEDPNEGEGAVLTTPAPAEDSEVEKEAKAMVKLGNAGE